MKVKYEADDGTLFEVEAACREYEAEPAVARKRILYYLAELTGITWEHVTPLEVVEALEKRYMITAKAPEMPHHLQRWKTPQVLAWRDSDERVERESARHIVRANLRQLAHEAWAEAGVKMDWGNDEQKKWYLYYYHEAGAEMWKVYHWFTSQALGITYFPTEEAARNAVAAIGEDNLMLLLED